MYKQTQEHIEKRRQKLKGRTMEPEQVQRMKDVINERALRVGENNPAAILTVEKVIDIKKRLMRGQRQIDIANYYGVDRHVIHFIAKGKTWNSVHIEESVNNG